MKTRLSLTGPLVVARDIAHAKIKERLDAGEQLRVLNGIYLSNVKLGRIAEAAKHKAAK